MATSIVHLRVHRPEERRLHAIYPLPDPIISLEEYCQLTHGDLALLDAGQLRRERHRLRHRPLLEEPPAPWLAERLAALDAELRRRGGRWAR